MAQISGGLFYFGNTYRDYGCEGTLFGKEVAELSQAKVSTGSPATSENTYHYGPALVYAQKNLPDGVVLKGWQAADHHLNLTARVTSMETLVKYCDTLERSNLMKNLRLKHCVVMAEGIQVDIQMNY